MELIQNNRCFEGEQRIYRFHSNALQTETQFGIFYPNKLWRDRRVLRYFIWQV